MLGTRGQAHTLEAFTAALLVLTGLLFALQATAVTPLSASTSNQHIENQERAMAADVLAVADDSGALEDAILNWTDDSFAGTDSSGIYANPTNLSRFGPFGEMLNRTFLDEGIAVNVYVRYRGAADGLPGGEPPADRRCTQNVTGSYCSMVYMGSPSDNAVVATRTVVLMDGDVLTGTNRSVADAAAAEEYMAPDAGTGSPLFNVVEVRLVVWQM